LVVKLEWIGSVSRRLLLAEYVEKAMGVKS